LAEGDVREILVINVSRIGDTLLVTPAIRAIAAAYPGARLTFLGHPKRMEIMENLPFIARAGSITKRRAFWSGRLASGTRYDLAFVYGNDLPLIEYALRVAKKAVAWRQGVASIDNRLYKAVEPPGFQSAHSVVLQMALPAALGIRPAGHRLAYRVTDQEAAWAEGTLARDLPHGAGPVIGLQVASFPTKGYRDWPIGHFIALCRRVLSEYGRSHFLIFGGGLERERTRELHRQFPGSSTVYAGKLSLRQTAALMSRLDLYIGVDTGPTHIMGTFDIPLVALYHCYSPSRLIAPLEHPCLYAVDHPDLGKGACGPETPMGKISVDTVWECVRAALASRQRPVQMVP
jgi:heptosyltransferase-3